MSRNEEGILARRRLMHGNDREKSAAAAFELGVYYSDQLGGEVEAELCFRHAIAMNHPAISPPALLNLSGLLQRVGRIDEAAQTYRTLIDLKDASTLTMAIYALGVLLSSQPSHMEEGESYLRRAATSNDPEYGPLASYDLGVLLSKLPGRLSEALEVLTRAAASKHAEYAPRAWFNLGALLAPNGAQNEAEDAFRQAIVSNDPNIGPMAAVNLGALLAEDPGRLADAEAAYRFAIDSNHPRQAPLALFNLANLLAELPERVAESQDAYRRAMLSTDTPLAAGAAYNLGVLLVTDPSRRADAEAAFRFAVTSDDPEHGPIAMYNLGRLLAANVNRWADARQVLEEAIRSGDPRVVGPATNLQSQLECAHLPERLIPKMNDDWRPTRVVAQGVYYLEEYLPGSETTDDWTAIVTATQIANPDLTPQSYMDAVRRTFEGDVVDGRLSWSILGQTETELIYESDIADDVANLDQNEISRIVRRNGQLYTIQHAIRGELARARADRPRRLALLHAAKFERAPAPSPVASPALGDHAFAAICKQAAASSTMSIAERLAFCRESLKRVSKDGHPELWAMLHFQLALALVQRNSLVSTNDDDLNQIAASLRRALEIYKKESHSDLWGRALASLGRTEFARARHHASSDMAVEKALAQRSLSHAIAAFTRARTAFKPGTFDWSRIAGDLGDVQLSVDIEAASATYTEMLRILENMPPLTKEDQASDIGGAIGELTIRAIVGIQSIDRLKDGEPVVPRNLFETEKRGQLFYLRPLLNAAGLRLPNQCIANAFTVGYRVEPDNITLEALLYRALAVELNSLSLGGRPDGYGSTRMIIAAGGTNWRSTLKELEERSDLIFMVPHLSEGVRWELELLIKRRALGKTLFVMPPLATDIDVAKLWAEAALMMGEYDLRVPPYQPDGSIFSFGPDGRIASKWEFQLLWNNELMKAIAPFLRRRSK
jgi:tetratricopeptide (TPR) repeat protein